MFRQAPQHEQLVLKKRLQGAAMLTGSEPEERRPSPGRASDPPNGCGTRRADVRGASDTGRQSARRSSPLMSAWSWRCLAGKRMFAPPCSFCMCRANWPRGAPSTARQHCCLGGDTTVSGRSRSPAPQCFCPSHTRPSLAGQAKPACCEPGRRTALPL